MLSIGRLGTTGGADYYLDKVANSVDDYYLGRGEAPGRWIGAASKQMGLAGEVDGQILRNLLAGTSPSGENLGLQLRPERRPGYDLTFSAPKGVSLLWALGPRDLPGTISDAHDRAVVAVLDRLSAEACYVRRGRNGKQLVDAGGFVGAAFRHRTSRAGDPQLHTHVVVPNLVKGSDGRCRLLTDVSSTCGRRPPVPSTSPLSVTSSAPWASLGRCVATAWASCQTFQSPFSGPSPDAEWTSRQ
jgi:conjugative relaxase-like TrwC/TraI family protein